MNYIPDHYYEGDTTFLNFHFKYEQIINKKKFFIGYGIQSDLLMTTKYNNKLCFYAPFPVTFLCSPVFGIIDFPLNNKKTLFNTNELGVSLFGCFIGSGFKVNLFNFNDKVVFINPVIKYNYYWIANSFFPSFSISAGYKYKHKIKNKTFHPLFDTIPKPKKEINIRNKLALSFELSFYLPRSFNDGCEKFPTPQNKENAYYWSFYEHSGTEFFDRFLPFLNLHYYTKKMNVHTLGIGYIKKNISDYYLVYSYLENDIKDFNLFYQYDFLFLKKTKIRIFPTIGMKILYNNKFIITNLSGCDWDYDITDNSNKELLQMVGGIYYSSKKIIINGGININLIGITSGKYNYSYSRYYSWNPDKNIVEYYPNNRYSKFLTFSDFQKKHLLFHSFNISIGYIF